MTDDEVIRALEEYREHKVMKELQGTMMQALAGISAPAIANRPSMLEVLEQVESADRRSTMNFQDATDQEAQQVLNIILDL